MQNMTMTKKTRLLLDFFPSRVEIAKKRVSYVELAISTSVIPSVSSPRKLRCYMECDCACK